MVIKCIIIFIPGMTSTVVIKLFIWMILFNSSWFNTGRCMNNTLFLWYSTANCISFPISNCVYITPRTLCCTNTKNLWCESTNKKNQEHWWKEANIFDTTNDCYHLWCLWVLHIVDSNKSVMDKVFYYAIMTKISIIKSSSDLDNRELFPVSGSSSQKVWISSYSDTEEEKNIDTDDPESSESDILESLSFSVCKPWQKR